MTPLSLDLVRRAIEQGIAARKIDPTRARRLRRLMAQCIERGGSAAQFLRAAAEAGDMGPPRRTALLETEYLEAA